MPAKKAAKKIHPVKSAESGVPPKAEQFNRAGKKEPRKASSKQRGKKVEAQVAEEVKPKLRIKLRAYDHKIVDNSARQIIDIATRYGAEVMGPVPLPTEIAKFTVNRSSFVHKNAREQFEIRIHKRLIDILNPKPDILEALKDINLPSGVDITVKI